TMHGGAHRYFALAAAAGHLEAHHRLAVQARRRPRLGHRVAHLRHVLQLDAAAAGDGDLHARDLTRGLHGGERAHRLLATTEVGAAARALALHLAQLARDVGGSDAQRLQLERVERDADLTGDAAHAIDGADAGHG